MLWQRAYFEEPVWNIVGDRREEVARRVGLWGLVVAAGLKNIVVSMAGMLNFSSRNLPRSLIRIIQFKYREIENSQITLRARAYHQGCLHQLSCVPVGKYVINPRDIPKCLHIRQFQSSRVLCDETKIVTVPPFAESVSEGDVRWEKAVGDAVGEDEVVLEIETDKTSVTVPSPANGIIEERYVEDGTTVKAGQKLFKLKVTGVAPVKSEAPKAAAPQPSSPPAAAAPPPPPPPAAAAHPAPPPPPSQPPPPAAPMASIPVAAIRHAQAIEAATVKVPPADPTKEISGTRSEQRVKMNRMRLRIAQRLKEAQNTNAMLTTFNEIDMSNIMEFRKQHLEAFQKKFNMKFGFMSAFVKASAYALQDQPVINAVIDGTDIVYRDYIDISVAVATPKGLVVPVLRNVESMNYADIELGIAALGEKARKGALAVEDMDGGTFTISNGGVFGSLMGTPIINPPQSAILGMHGIFDRPIAVKGQVVIRPMMYVALTYDHRLIDGREAVLFLRKIKASVEDPRIMFLGL